MLIMENYIDPSFIVTAGTIISYSGKNPVQEIPGKPGNIRISAIGDAAFMESQALQCVIIPEGVKRIGHTAFHLCTELQSVLFRGDIPQVDDNSAFSCCNKLSDITINKMRLSQKEYIRIKNASAKTDSGLYISGEIPENNRLRELINSVYSVNCSELYVPADSRALYVQPEYDIKAGVFRLDKKIRAVGLSDSSGFVREEKAVSEFIKNRKEETSDKKTEQNNDIAFRTNKTILPRKKVIFTFDDTKTTNENGEVFIKAIISFGYIFTMSAQGVLYNGKQYYIYRRHYLNDSRDMKYIRRDIAVFSENRLVTDRKEATEVYAKYKLLSIL